MGRVRRVVHVGPLRRDSVKHAGLCQGCQDARDARTPGMPEMPGMSERHVARMSGCQGASEKSVP
eukprot:4400025-Pyramimonas_sp.AAC.1